MNSAKLPEVVLASGNAGKAGEFQQRLGQWLQIRSQSEWHIQGAEETGLTFVENALIKARHVCAATGLPALADDSGLCVDALQGAPGIYSARFAGAGATDAQNNQQLLEALEQVADDARTAHFACVLVLMRHARDPQPLICEARWPGRILQEPKGSNGFGYDPLFQPEGLACTSAELSPEAKNHLSHRGQAMDQLIQALEAGLLSR